MGCFTVKADYKGDHPLLKGKFGGCGKCDDKKTFVAKALSADDKKFCTDCDKEKCNLAPSSATKASVFGIGMLVALWYSL